MSKKKNVESVCIGDLENSYLLSAGAGTGKTYTLTNRYYQILRQKEEDIGGILAITFTEKATHEMLVKIRELVRNELTRNENTENREYWERIYNTLPFAQITTVHSWCARIVREAALFLGLEPDFQIMDEFTTTIFFADVYERFIHSEMGREDLKIAEILNYMNHNTLKEFLLSITNKRIQFTSLSEQGAFPDIEKLWSDLSQFFVKRVIYSGTWRELILALKMLKPLNEDDKLASKRANVLVFDRKCRDRERFEQAEFSDLMESLKGRGGRKSAWEEGEIDKAQNIIKRLKAILKEYENIFSGIDAGLEEKHRLILPAFLEIGERFLQLYRDELKRKNLLDFHSLEVETIRFINKYPEKWESIASRINYILVDEFQDINPDQFFIIDSLIKTNRKINFLFVGDEKQSIYGFRNAEVTIFKGIRSGDYFNGINEALRFNFRSVPSLVKFQNAFFSHLMSKSQRMCDFEATYEVEIDAVKEIDESGKTVKFLIPRTSENLNLNKWEAEFTAVAKTIRRLVESGSIIDEERGEKRPVRFSDICILLRNRTHAESLKGILRTKGIPYTAIFGKGFYESREVIDLLNYLKILFNPEDDLSLVGVLRSPFVGLSDTSLFLIHQWKGGKPWFYAIEELIRQDKPHFNDYETGILREFVKNYHELQEIREEKGLSEFLYELMHRTGYIYVVAGLADGKRRVANLHKLLNIAYSLEKTAHLSLYEFSGYTLSLSRMGAEEGEVPELKDEAVQLMTIHRSKGLEFPVVFLVETDNSTKGKSEPFYFHDDYGLALKIEDKDKGEAYLPVAYRLCRFEKMERELAEEKRLFYVAATRAKYLLFLSAGDAGFPDKDEPIDLPGSYYDWFCNWKTEKPRDYAKFIEPEIVDITEKDIAESEEESPAEEEVFYPYLDKLITGILPAKSETPVTVNPSLLPELMSQKDAPVTTKDRDISDLKNLLLTPPEITGTLTHKFLQIYFNTNQSYEKVIKKLNRDYILYKTEIDQNKTLWQNWIEQIHASPIGQYLRDFKEMRAEYNFSCLLDKIIFQGSIDLLISTEDKLVFVDWKTDLVNRNNLSRRCRYYHPQLMAYSLVLRKIFPEREISGGLFFLRIAEYCPFQFSEKEQNEFLNALSGKLIAL